MLGSQVARVVLRLLERLLDQPFAIALLEPCGDSCRQGVILSHRENRDFTAARRLAVVFAHRGFVRGQFILDFCALPPCNALQIALRICKLVAVEPQLRLGHFKVVAHRTGLCAIITGVLQRLGLGVEAIYQYLVLLLQLLKLGNLLRKCQRIPCERAVLCVQARLPQRRGKCLVHLVIGEPLSLARVLSLLRSGCQRSQRLCRLPGLHIDQRLASSWRSAFSAEISHCAACGPRNSNAHTQ